MVLFENDNRDPAKYEGQWSFDFGGLAQNLLSKTPDWKSQPTAVQEQWVKDLKIRFMDMIDGDVQRELERLGKGTEYARLLDDDNFDGEAYLKKNIPRYSEFSRRSMADALKRSGYAQFA